ncbi:TSUP family transporter [Lutimaribacter sp. EGI FJ00015]|uniref:TSUP family transporter n=1 Tax=Lutimaribacter degradans TaxID=2945989 RepID=A0ACC5ZXY0_9RHOB|nr:TSUP family transporter [Lutimaribacter sp. EGI FJ00013]MCM2563050.1 TSUP family transporter [Lutimaribacter sp. EGI FJ00013]MCO0614229.1 TSUP family transporter [Lutimaribacter sp. EGI FJ00015]MCO0637039.1 TSUP family transporter [Lutimaribacter sp. EGI FJ00014]
MMAQLDLSSGLLTWLVVVVFLAGMVRGFTGFAASATIMALATVWIAPIDLIPICLLLELTASALLMRGGFGDADKPLALTLVGMGLVGVPLGLALTKTLDPDVSRMIALALVAVLATMQLLRIPLPIGRGRAGAAAVGLLAGVVNGLASIGGLVHALYIMARNLPPRSMRGTMIVIITIGGTITFFWQVVLGILTTQATLRYGVLLVPFVAGLALGRHYFTPETEQHYRPVCLTLLVVLAALGLVRQVM